MEGEAIVWASRKAHYRRLTLIDLFILLSRWWWWWWWWLSGSPTRPPSCMRLKLGQTSVAIIVSISTKTGVVERRAGRFLNLWWHLWRCHISPELLHIWGEKTVSANAYVSCTLVSGVGNGVSVTWGLIPFLNVVGMYFNLDEECFWKFWMRTFSLTIREVLITRKFWADKTLEREQELVKLLTFHWRGQGSIDQTKGRRAVRRI